MHSTRILGVDPGTRIAGWAVVETGPGRVARRLDSGIWRLGAAGSDLPQRLLKLRRAVQESVARWRPDMLAVESAYFGRNANSALRLGEARGVVLATAAETGLEIRQIPPAVVKKRVAGSGNAAKEQLARLVRAQVELHRDFESWDESDAVAVALCGALEIGDPGAGASSSRDSGLPPGAQVQ